MISLAAWAVWAASSPHHHLCPSASPCSLLHEELQVLMAPASSHHTLCSLASLCKQSEMRSCPVHARISSLPPHYVCQALWGYILGCSNTASYGTWQDLIHGVRRELACRKQAAWPTR